MSSEEIYYSIALTRLTGVNHAVILERYQSLGGGKAVYDECKARFSWDEALRRAAAEMEFIEKNGIKAMTLQDDDYPQRLKECPDAPIVLFYKGEADLNQCHIINIVGTRHCTNYGQDIVRRFVKDLRQLCPDVLIVSGLAYGIDVCAHRQALDNGFETVGVLAHGLDQIYPPHHRAIAVEMLKQGGLLTEYMSQTQALPNNFRQRNRIVAGMSDATILVESAIKGCNRMIRNNTAALITSAQDFVVSMGWQTVKQKPEAVERQLFPDLSAEEQQVVALLQQTNDLQLNLISVKTNIPIGQLTAMLFSLEMKGVVKPLAGGTYHLIK